MGFLTSHFTVIGLIVLVVIVMIIKSLDSKTTGCLTGIGPIPVLLGVGFVVYLLLGGSC